MHNVPMAARNAVVSVAKKVEDNVLRVMTAPVVTHRHPLCQLPQKPIRRASCPRRPTPSSSSRYACLQEGSRQLSRALSQLKPRSNHGTSHTSPSALLLGKSLGATSPRARPLRAS